MENFLESVASQINLAIAINILFLVSPENVPYSSAFYNRNYFIGLCSIETEQHSIRKMMEKRALGSCIAFM